jgi:TetR/AcrR family transcriptional regulator, transcriptional repressor for nem operon
VQNRSIALKKGDLPKSTRPESLAGFVLNGWEGALLRSQADKSDAPLKDFLHFVFEDLLAKCVGAQPSGD